jgi:hypothetical protein
MKEDFGFLVAEMLRASTLWRDLIPKTEKSYGQ